MADAESRLQQQLEGRRRLLQRLVGVVRLLERTRQGLQAVLILGQGSDPQASSSALAYFNALSDKVRRQPPVKIQRYLRQLQLLLGNNLQQILEISQPVTRKELDDAEGALLKAGDQLVEFRRRAQTAVSLKILLARQGLAAPGFPVAVPVALIRERLQDLEQARRWQRQKLRRKMDEMADELRQMLQSPDFSDALRASVQAALDEIEQDRQALERGVPIEQIPFFFEVVETGESRREPGKAGEAPGATADPATSDSEWNTDEPRQPNGSDPAEGFFATLWRWLNTPWRVSWRQLRRRRR